MEREEILRLISSIHNEKGLDKEVLFNCLEVAMETAARKRFGAEYGIEVRIDRETGEIIATDNEGYELELKGFGRIAAQTAKQVMMQKIREAESNVIFSEFEHKVGDLVTGVIQRLDHGNAVLNLGRAEGFLPRSEQVFNEAYTPGQRVRCYVTSVKRKGQKVVILLSRTHPHLVKEFFKMEIPEISDKIIEVKAIAREPGHRTKIAVSSNDPKVDSIGACVGVRGSRIRTIVEELNGEKIDIVPWSDTTDIFIVNSLSPAEIASVTLDKSTLHARVVVPDDQLSLAIGKRGQNVRLSAKLTGWHIDVITESELQQLRDYNREALAGLPHMQDGALERFYLSGVYTLDDLLAAGADLLIERQSLTEEQAEECLEVASEHNELLKETIKQKKEASINDVKDEEQDDDPEAAIATSVSDNNTEENEEISDSEDASLTDVPSEENQAAPDDAQEMDADEIENSLPTEELPE